MRLIPRSIQRRMLVLSLVATLTALAIAGMAIGGVLGRFVTQGLDQRLDAQLVLLASVVDGDGGIDHVRLDRLRDVLDAGPGWHWRIAAPNETIASADPPPDAHQPDLFPAPPRHDRHGPKPGDGRDRRGRPMHSRQITIDTPSGAVILTTAAPRAIVSTPIRAAIMPLLATLAILGLVLGSAAIVQVRLGLRPLRRLREQVIAIRIGAGRSIDENQPEELRPLAVELNALVRDNDAALAAARASAANLAHGLKTPVATLALEVRDEPVLAAQVDRIYRTIRHHLARARNGIADTRAATPLAPAVADLVATIARFREGGRLSIDQAIPSDIAVRIDAADLDELIGNLIDNAVRHAAERVIVQGTVSGRFVRLTVTDDGAGIPAADRERATRPGVRLDEREDGDGFGLAIARDIAELHGGRLVLDEAPGGGLAASIDLPIARPD